MDVSELVAGRSKHGWFPELGVNFLGVLRTRALLFGAAIQAPDE